VTVDMFIEFFVPSHEKTVVQPELIRLGKEANLYASKLEKSGKDFSLGKTVD